VLRTGLDPQALLAIAIVLAIMLLVALPFHEFAHALTAYRLGDSTARLSGRLTLDPRAHWDPTGGLMLVISFALFGFGIGWAKPTPVNLRNLRGGRWGEVMVSAAGPISNLILAVAGAIPLRYVLATGMDAGLLSEVLFLFVEFNLLLLVINLIPVPPLDGSNVLFAFLDPMTAWRLRITLQQYGLLILAAMAFLPVFGGQTLLSLIFGVFLEPLLHLLTGV
jgi:Zn-dependent protease